MYLSTHPPIYLIYLSIYLSIYLWFCSLCGPWPLFQFLNLYAVGRTPWTGNQAVARPLSAHRTTQIENKRTQTSMSRVRFEPTIPVFERVKTVHALDRAATVIGRITAKRRLMSFGMWCPAVLGNKYQSRRHHVRDDSTRIHHCKNLISHGNYQVS
jgi:hypothetical protein